MLLPITLLGAPVSPELDYDEDWVEGPVLRYPPATLINPVEPGTNFDANFPGRGYRRKPISNGFDSITVPDTLDLLVATTLNEGGAGNGFPDASVTPRIGRPEFAGGRRVRAVGADITLGPTAAGFSLKPGPGTERIDMIGVCADFRNGPESDAIGITGAPSGVGPIVTVQDYCFLNIHGTAQQHDAGRAVSSATVSGATILINTSTTAPSALSVGQDVIYGGSITSAFKSTWTIQSIGTGVIVAYANHGIPLPPDGSTQSGGTLWALNGLVLGIHADMAQGFGIGKIARLRLHKGTGSGNYDCLVVGQRIDTGVGVAETIVSNLNWRHADVDPQDYSTFWGLAGDYDTTSGTVTGRGARKANLELFNVWHEGRAHEVFGNSIIPQAGRTVDGKPMGMRVSLYKGRIMGSFPKNPTSSIRGVLYQGTPPGGDFAPYANLGAGYTSPGYSGRSAVAPAPTVTLSATAYVADDPRGKVIGLLSCPGYEDGWIVDITLTDDAGGRVQIVARELQRGVTAYDGGTFNITVRARVRGTAVYADFTFAITCTAATSPAYGSMSDGNAVAFVRALHSYSSLTAPDLAFFDGYFAALKAIDGGAVWPLLTRKSAAATLDERDVGINWFNPSDLEILPYYQPKAWTANVGYAGSPVAPAFHVTRPGFTPTQAGLLQNSCTLMAGISIKAPGEIDGALPSGTEYVAGANNVTADGFGGIFLGITATGQVTCKCANDSTKNTAATPFSATGGAMRHMAVTRTASTGFRICYGARNTGLTIDTTTAGSGASSASSPLTVRDMWVNGRNGATANGGSRTVHYEIWGKGLTAAQIDAVRAVEDTWLDHIGVA